MPAGLLQALLRSGGVVDAQGGLVALVCGGPARLVESAEAAALVAPIDPKAAAQLRTPPPDGGIWAVVIENGAARVQAVALNGHAGPVDRIIPLCGA